jgi:hypothetical protein
MRSAAAVAGKPTMTGKPAACGEPAMTASEPAAVGKSTTTSEPAAIKPTIGNSATPKPAAHIPALDKTTTTITGRGPTASTVPTTKATIVKTTAVKISGIPSFKERAIVSIVIVIPVVTVPGRIVIINISGELVFIHYAGSSRICILILIYGGRRRRRRCIIFLRVASDGNQAGPYNGHERK